MVASNMAGGQYGREHRCMGECHMEGSNMVDMVESNKVESNMAEQCGRTQYGRAQFGST